MQALNNF